MKPLKQQHEIDRNGHIRRDDQMTPRTTSSRNIVEYDKWIQGIKSSGAQFGKPGSPSPGAWSSRILQSDSDDKILEQDPDADADRSSSPVLLLQNSGNASFPATRTQEISNYRKEMMEMVRGLPDGDFELTLQDIVEKKREFKEVEPVSVSTDEKKETRRKKNQKKYVKRSHSIDTGLLTRMFLPLSIAVRRKSLKVRDHLSGKKDEIDEKKQVVNAKKKSKDEEWWRNNEFSEKGSSNSSSVGSSTSNGSNSSTGDNDHFSRNMTMKKSKCYCFRPGKSKAKSS